MDLHLCFICFLVSSFVLAAFFFLICPGKRSGMNMKMILPSLRQMHGSLLRLKSWKLSEHQRNEKVPQSNFEAEMKRRNKLNDIYHILHALLPNNTGMDRASVIGDTIAHVSKLQRQVKQLQQELERKSNGGAKETSYICRNNGNFQSEFFRQIETVIANTPENEKMEAAMMIMPYLIHRLRSLVGLKGWDCCVLWKLSEDQRFIELIDCCCAGTEITQTDAGHNLPFPPVLACRDTILQHPRTTSCDLLAQIPSSMPLDSGIYAETLISNQTSWLNFSNNTFLSTLEETIGTRVVIPIPGGIIELLVTKQVFEDQNVIDFVTAQYNISLEEALTNITAENGFQEIEMMQRSITSERQQHMDMQQYMEALVPNIDQQEGNEKRDSNTHEAEGQAGDFMSDCSDQIDEEEQAKNLIAERKIRKKLNDRLYALRCLVPIISKLDKVSILEDAIEYVKQLQKQAKQLQDELDVKSEIQSQSGVDRIRPKTDDHQVLV